MSATPVAPGDESATQFPSCYRHPGVEMAVRCHRCERPICPDCMINASVGFHCPECAKLGARQSPTIAAPWRQRATATTPVTIALIAVNAGVFLLGMLSPQLNNSIFVKGAVSPNAVAAGQYYRLLTSMFVHDGLLHIAFNMYALWIFGSLLERELGKWWYLGLYMVSGLVGGALFIVLAAPGTPAIGASGAIFGLFGAMIAYTLTRRHTPAGRALWTQLLVLLGINLAFGFLPGTQIAWQAHLGGLAFGFAAGWVFDRSANPAARLAVLTGGVALTIVAISFGAPPLGL